MKMDEISALGFHLAYSLRTSDTIHSSSRMISAAQYHDGEVAVAKEHNKK